MSAASATVSIVIDASLATRIFLPASSCIDAERLFAEWRKAGARVISSMLWFVESVSAIRKAVFARAITGSEGQAALADLLRLGAEPFAIDSGQCRSALHWAERLGQSRAYDGFYLALAEKLDAPLWTADKRLANPARQAGIAWVHSVG